jgi:prevent-host-death family protein
MEAIGLRELRQQASDLIRRVEAGEQLTITVAGRPSARLVPLAPRSWRRWDEIADLFAGRADADWDGDREFLDDHVRDPWPTR